MVIKGRCWTSLRESLRNLKDKYAYHMVIVYRLPSSCVGLNDFRSISNLEANSSTTFVIVGALRKLK